MTKRQIIPSNIIKSKGKLWYGESGQAWNIIRLNNELIRTFPQLKEKRSKFTYEILYNRNIKEFMNTIKKIKTNEALPLLLWVFKEDNFDT
ncbi:MAG: hypothetical protein KKF48_02180 [Nanoarchaeota archaeon]|nr:hypothetical protein [Nanoarchaeota archaeon]MBU1027827.1 hypothetical protein [Nanoarchaeota archaeon]